MIDKKSNEPKAWWRGAANAVRPSAVLDGMGVFPALVKWHAVFIRLRTVASWEELIHD